MQSIIGEHITNSEQETYYIGQRLGAMLKKGSIVCICGDLGTGKTVLVRGIANALDINDYITSPTFTIVNEYNGKINLNHFDVYRVYDPDELYDIGFEEYIYSDSVSVIEWADLIQDIIPSDALWINIDKNESNFNQRIITIRKWLV